MCNRAYIYANLRRMCMSLFFFVHTSCSTPLLGEWIYLCESDRNLHDSGVDLLNPSYLE